MTIRAALFLLIISLAATGRAQNVTRSCPAPTEWLSASLKQIQNIKAGMTRAELLQMFQPEAGFRSSGGETFAYRGSPYIKVDVVFESQSEQRPGPHDKIVNISKPYLDPPRYD